jgi:hypothetical protein
MLSATLGFCLWFGGGWVLASQVSLSADGETFDAQMESAPAEIDSDAWIECSPDTWADPGESRTSGT